MASVFFLNVYLFLCPVSFKIDEDDPDLLALREIALSSLVAKEKNRVHNDGNQNFQQDHRSSNSNFPTIGQSNHPMRFNGMNFAPNRPNFHHEPYPAPVRSQPFFNPLYQQQLCPRQSFMPHRQPFLTHPLPHLNPNFVPLAHDPQHFVPVVAEIPGPMIGRPVDTNEEIAMIQEKNSSAFEPTPPSRLSPRSAMFVAENNEALRRLRRRSFTSRSRSRSPYRRYASRSRSRSPPYKGQISHIVQKRNRSKTPNKFRQSRSPRRRSRSLEKRVSPKFPDNGRNEKRNRPFRPNGGQNRDRNGKYEGDNKNQDRRTARISPRNVDKDKFDTTEAYKKTEQGQAESLQQQTRETKQVDSKPKREKTEQEIEDELLASTDSEASAKDDDEEEFKVTLDENELDFLDDDEEESENEGRFKSKTSSTSTQPKKVATLNNFKSSFQSRHNEKFKNDRNFSRNDFKRNKYNDRDRKNSRSRSPATANQRPRGSSPRKLRKSSEAQKSPEVVAQSSQKIIIIKNKEKTEAAKEEPKKVNAPMFKATFKTVEPLVEDKKKGMSE